MSELPELSKYGPTKKRRVAITKIPDIPVNEHDWDSDPVAFVSIREDTESSEAAQSVGPQLDVELSRCTCGSPPRLARLGANGCGSCFYFCYCGVISPCCGSHAQARTSWNTKIEVLQEAKCETAGDELLAAARVNSYTEKLVSYLVYEADFELCIFTKEKQEEIKDYIWAAIAQGYGLSHKDRMSGDNKETDNGEVREDPASYKFEVGQRVKYVGEDEGWHGGPQKVTSRRTHATGRAYHVVGSGYAWGEHVLCDDTENCNGEESLDSAEGKLKASDEISMVRTATMKLMTEVAEQNPSLWRCPAVSYMVEHPCGLELTAGGHDSEISLYLNDVMLLSEGHPAVIALYEKVQPRAVLTLRDDEQTRTLVNVEEALQWLKNHD